MILKRILGFKLPIITDLDNINFICSYGYKETGNKFSVNFNGSKGYLSNIEVSCEGKQEERTNVIWVERMRTRSGKLKSKNIKIYHCEELGIIITIGNELPKLDDVVFTSHKNKMDFIGKRLPFKKKEQNKNTSDVDDDLPF